MSELSHHLKFVLSICVSFLFELANWWGAQHSQSLSLICFSVDFICSSGFSLTGFNVLTYGVKSIVLREKVYF